MTRFFYILFTLLLLVIQAGTASAQEGRVYFATYMGLNVYDGMEFRETTTGRSGDLDYESSTRWAGALGVKYDSNLRLEVEVSYDNTDGEIVNFDNGIGNFTLGGQLQTILGMFNAYYDLDVNSEIKPYIGGGIGFAWADISINDSSGLVPNASNDDIGFAWQMGTGLRYQLSDDVSILGGYRYLDTVDFEIDSYEIDFDTHEFRLGVEYAFPAY